MDYHPGCGRTAKRQTPHSIGKAEKKKNCGKERHNRDCIDEEKLEEQEKRILKITYQKCKEKKKKKRGTGKLGAMLTIRCIPYAEVLLKSIKPSMAEREKFFSGRHLDCISEKVHPVVDLIALRDEWRRPRIIRKPCVEPKTTKKRKKKKKKTTGPEDQTAKEKKDTSDEPDQPRDAEVVEPTESRSATLSKSSDPEPTDDVPNKEDDVPKKEDEATEKEDPATEQEDSATEQEASATEQEAPATEQEVPAAEQEAYATEQEDSATEQEDSVTEREDSATEKEDSATEKDDAAFKEENAAKVEAAAKKDKAAAKKKDASAESTKKKRKPDKFWCPKRKKLAIAGLKYESRQPEPCESVCSFDSEVCLAGMPTVELMRLWEWMRLRIFAAVCRFAYGIFETIATKSESLPTNLLPSASKCRYWGTCCIFMLMTLGLLGLASGCFVLVCQPYEFLFRLKVIFSEGGEIFEIWRKPNVDLYLKVYLFNVTNREAYLSGEDEKLSLQEVGPYVYKELLEHGDITFNSNGTITAIPVHPLMYVPEMSNGTENDLLVLPNIALLSITNVMRDASYITRWGLNMLIRQTDAHPLVQMTAREFMFGYESSLVTLGNQLMPSWIKFDKLGLIDRMYDFDGDYETVYTGEHDVRMTGLIEKYNGNVDLPQWTGRCANVNGSSDGVKFQSYITPNDTLLFFRKSLCRSARITHAGHKVVKGLHTYKYKFMENEMDNGAFNPENKCFCRQGHCLQPGLIDVTDCYYGFPIALSFPHFYKADASLLNAVDGLNPRAGAHESYFYIQPQSGLPVDLAFRFQINMALQNIGHMSRVEKFDNMVLPLLWFEIGMHELPDALNSRFILYLNVLPTVQEVIIYTLFVAGVVLLIWSVVRILIYRPNGNSLSSAHWFDLEVQKKRLRFLNDRRASVVKGKEMDIHYSSLLCSQKEENLTTSELEEISSLKDSVV